MALGLIVAASTNGVIGKDNSLLWHLPNDFKFFKSVTTGHAIIMGRKTFESIGKPLPNRVNIVVSSDFSAPGILVFASLDEAIAEAFNHDSHPFIIGGANIYKQAYSKVDKIYHTEVDVELEGDAFFTYPDSTEWTCNFEEKHQADEKHKYNYTFRIFDRI